MRKFGELGTRMRNLHGSQYPVVRTEMSSRHSSDQEMIIGTQLVRVSQRNGNIEVFRCLLMFLIVLYHNWYYGIFPKETWWAPFFSSLIVWHVDGFVAISGWYGIKFSWKKFFSLWGVIVFYSVLGLILWKVFDGETFPGRSVLLGTWSPFISGGWFGGSYLALMLMAPFLNVTLFNLKGFSEWGLVALAITLGWAPQHLFSAVAPSGLGSGTICTLVFIYVTGRVLRLNVKRPIPARFLCLIIIAYVTLTLGATWGVLLFERSRGLPPNLWVTKFYWTYFAPHVWTFAFALLMLFEWHVRFPNWVCRLFSFFAPSMFGVYLLHDVIHFGHSFVGLQNWFAVKLPVHPIGNVFLSAFITFIVCLGVDLLRRFSVRALLGLWRRNR